MSLLGSTEEEQFPNDNDLSFDSSASTSISIKEALSRLGEVLSVTVEEALFVVEKQIEILEAKGYAYKATTDLAFKYIFSQQENLRILENFLNDIIENATSERKHITLVSAESVSRVLHAASKTIINDILATDSEGNTYNFEMQRSINNHFTDRMLYYSCMQIAQNLERGEKYSSLKRHTVIVISLDPWIGEYNFDTVIPYSTNNKAPFTDKLVWYNVVARASSLTDENISPKVRQWLFFLIHGTVQNESNNQSIEDAADRLKAFLTTGVAKFALTMLTDCKDSAKILLRTVTEELKTIDKKVKKKLEEANVKMAEAIAAANVKVAEANSRADKYRNLLKRKEMKKRTRLKLRLRKQIEINRRELS